MKSSVTGHGAGASRAWVACIGVWLSMVSMSAPAKAEGEARPLYQAHCVFPRAAWNEEILHVRDAAERECKANTVLHDADRSVALSTEAQDHFWKLKGQHDALVRSAH